MARPLRIEYPGAFYHVTARGNRKNDIFLNDEDRLLFLKVLNSTIKSHNWICHAYCLMDNHFHLAIETPDGNLSNGMRDLNGVYTQSHNKKHKTVGHLFQGRFKSFLIEKETYLLAVVRYIVLNPVRAEVVISPKDWPWSSFCATAGLDDPQKWLTIDWVLSLFSKNQKTAQKEYYKFVLDGIDSASPFNEIREGTILGSPQFIDCISEATSDIPMTKEIPRSERIIGRPTLEDLFNGIKKDKALRNKTILFARFRCGYSVSGIARHINLSCSAVSRILRRESKK